MRLDLCRDSHVIETAQHVLQLLDELEVGTLDAVAALCEVLVTRAEAEGDATDDLLHEAMRRIDLVREQHQELQVAWAENS